MPTTPLRWIPDPQSAAILAAYRRTREPLRSVLRRALHHLATADGILDPRGRIRTTPPGTRPTPGNVPAARRPTA